MSDPTFVRVMTGDVSARRVVNFIRKKMNEQGKPSRIKGSNGKLTPAYHGADGCRCPIGFLLSKQTMASMLKNVFDYDGVAVKDLNTSQIDEVFEVFYNQHYLPFYEGTPYYSMMSQLPTILFLTKLQEAHDAYYDLPAKTFMKKFNEALNKIERTYANP